MLLGKGRVQLLIAQERREHLGQSRNNAQLWMCLVVKVKSDTVKKKKIYIYIYIYCIGTWNVKSMNQGKLDMVRQEMARVKHQHLRNQ